MMPIQTDITDVPSFLNPLSLMSTPKKTMNVQQRV
jgi:hypothetical protein